MVYSVAPVFLNPLEVNVVKYKKSTMFLFIAPAMILFIVFFCYPVIRTLAMSFFDVESISSSVSSWKFVGVDNFVALGSSSFPETMKTLLKIWGICGFVVFIIALVFAVLLTSGVYGKNFFRAMLYLTNVIPQIAIGYMWTLYVFSSRFGMLKKMFTALGLQKLADFGWTSPDNMFLSMCIAYVFSNVGYFVLMYMASIENIPQSLYEAAEIDGAKAIGKLFCITLPLIKNTLISSITIWTTRVCAFFALSKVFVAADTVSPLMYVYNVIFGSESGNTAVGVGAAAAVLIASVVVIVFMLSNLIPKNQDIEM